jgi:hypothetical protein
MIGPFDYAEVTLAFDICEVDIKLYQPEETDPSLRFGVIEAALGRQASFIVQMCTQALSLLSNVSKLCIQSDSVTPELDDLEDLLDNPVWLELFHLFTAILTLHLSSKIQPCIVSSLRGHIGERVTEVLPEFHDLYLHHGYRRNSVEEQAIDLFIASFPVTLPQPTS